MNSKYLLIVILLFSVMLKTASASAFSKIGMREISCKGKYISENTEAFYARWMAIANAKHSIVIDVFFFGDDVLTKALLGALLFKAKDGVEITIMADAKAQMPDFALGEDYFRQLVHYGEGNIKVQFYNSLYKKAAYSLFPFLAGHWWEIKVKDFVSSNHDKLMIVDDSVIIMGGRNIGVEYLADHKDLPIAWRDSDLLLVLNEPSDAREYYQAVLKEQALITNSDITVKNKKQIRPELAYEMIKAYKAVRNWIQRAPIYELLKDYSTLESELIIHKNLRSYLEYNQNDLVDLRIKVLDKVSAINSSSNDITKNLISMIDEAKKEIIIQNPYVVLTERMFAALKRAHDRNVHIVLHTNSLRSTDSLLTQTFFIEDWKRVRELLPNMEIYAFVGQRKMHSKLFVFDRKVSAVGTYNFDPMSENINSEIVTLVDSYKIADQIVEAVEKDIAESFDLTSPQNGANFNPINLGDANVQKTIKRNSYFKFIRPLI